MNYRNPRNMGRKQSGIALMDGVIYLILMLALASVIFYFANKANNTRVASNEAQNFSVMSADAQAKFAQQGSYAGASANLMIQLGVVPPSMISGNTIQSGWNSAVTVAPANLGGTANDGLAFTYQVPRRSCSDFLTASAASAARATVGGSVVLDEPNGVNNLNIAAVGTACNASAGSGNVAVVLTKGR